MSIHRELVSIVKELERNGYTVQRTPGKGGHLIVTNQDGRRLYSLPSTPGRGRGIANLRAALKRKGLLGSERKS